MTLDSTTSKVQYTQAGSTTEWPVTFKFLNNEDLIVVTTLDDVDTTLVLDTDYSVTGAGDDEGGAVTISPAVTAGTLVTIYRVVDLDQPTQLTTAGGWYPTVHEGVFDRLTMQIQQVQEQADRSLKIGVTDTRDPEDIIDDIFEARDDAQTAAAAAEDSAIRAEVASSTVAYYNHEGTLGVGEDTITLPWAYDTEVGVEVYLSGVKQTESVLTFTDAYTVTLDEAVGESTPFEVVASAGANGRFGELLAATDGADMVGYGAETVTDALDARPTSATLAASGGADLVGFLQSGTGAVARTVQDKMRDVVSVKDFGAVGDGVTDDTAAIQAALDSGAKNIFAIAGESYVISSLSIPDGVSLVSHSGRKNTSSGNSKFISSETTANVITLGSNTSIVGFHIYGISGKNTANGTETTNGIYIPSEKSSPSIRGCQVSNFGGAGIVSGDAGNISLRDVTVYECHSVGLALGFGCSDCFVESSTFRDNGSHGISVSGGANTNTFSACRIEWNLGAGCAITNCNGTVFIGCTFDRNTGPGIENKGESLRGRASVIGGIMRRNGAGDGSTGADDVCHILTQSIVGGFLCAGVSFLSGNTEDDGSGAVVPKYIIRNVNTTDSVVLAACSIKNGYTLSPLNNTGTITDYLPSSCDDQSNILLQSSVIARGGQITIRRIGATVPDRIVLNTNFNSFYGRQHMPELPTTTSGLTTGELYVDGDGFVKRL